MMVRAGTTITRAVPTSTARVLLVGLLLSTATACSGSGGGDDGPAGDAAWCEQFDLTMQASATLDEMGRDDPDVADALTVVQDQMGDLSRLEPPAAIAADWDVLTGRASTDDAGGVEMDGERAAAGRRVAAWALDECELSAPGRAAIEDEQDG